MKWKICLRILANRGWIILLMVVLVNAAVFVQNAAQKPIYQAVQRISLQPSAVISNSIQVISDAPETYTSWLSSLAQANQVVNIVELDMVPHQLEAAVSINRDPGEGFLDIVVEMGDATAALLIASTYGANFIQWMDQNGNRQGANRIRAILWDSPRLATKRGGPTSVRYATLLGVCLGLVAVFTPGIAGRLVSRIRHRVQVASAA